MKKWTLVAMLFLTEVVYLRPGMLLGRDSLMGSDYEMLHRWRLGFARDALFGARHTLPAWNPHELLGAPFAANLQSFPWIPTRLILLLFDPTVAFGVGVALAAALAAIFTYLYARRAGLSEIAAATAGWTFACAGYFSSRVMAGHLPLLEAYPALPLLLWLVDRALGGRRQDLAILAIACTCVVSAGHPQVPAYALAAAFLYVVWRGRGIGIALRARVAAAMALGVGMSFAIWWPMLQLIGRSTRILHLAAPDNDVAMPYSRLLALINPGAQGWAEPVVLAEKSPFTGYANNSYFWDTASYIGILPLVAIAGLLIACIVRKRVPDWRAKYLAFTGVGALLCSLPLANPLLHALPGTVLRSPARLLYISTFCAAIALGVGVDAARRTNWLGSAAVRNIALIALLAIHFVDLGGFDRWFIQTYPRDKTTPAFQAILDREANGFRVAEERNDEVFPYEARFDDAGGFDSIFLARFNRVYLALAGESPDTNEQVFDASALSPQALQALGVRFVITTQTRRDLERVDGNDDSTLYRVADPTPRATWFATGEAESMPEARIPAAFAANPQHRLLLASGGPHGSTPHPEQPVGYSRPSSDEIDLRTNSDQPGYVYLLESFDPGWKATVDGVSAGIEPANGFAMAIHSPTGRHAIHLTYETPGRTTGILLSLLSLTLLVTLITLARPAVTPAPPGLR